VTLINLVVARQAIFDRQHSIVAYEILFRSVPEHSHAATGLDGDLMTSTVLFNSLSIGIERLVGDKTIFCNADRGLLTGLVPVVLPPELTVIEVLESVEFDADVLAGCSRLVRRGYRLALDDFVWFEGAERYLELASVVKVDLLQTKPDELADVIERCRQYDVQLLAEKIETEEDYQRCLDLGFDLFQGYALARPRNVPGRTIESSRLGAIRLASSLMDDKFELDEIEEILRSEPGMTYQLLQLAAIGSRDGLRRPVHSLRDAVILVGSVRVQSWAALLLLRHRAGAAGDDLAAALARARMCELLAMSVSPGLGSLAFTAGMLSAFELLLRVPAEEIIAALPLDDELREAAFGGNSQIARIVRDVIDYQAGILSCENRRCGLDDTEFDRASIRSITWAVDAARVVNAT
jgi:c-di-GMP-related signal transduction protein